jgi:hypothetical protein
MRLIVSGFLSEHHGRVLLRQTGPRTLVPVTEPLDPGVLPADTLARAFRRETGLVVLPVRLTGLYYADRPAGGALTLVYRCTRRGGEISAAEATPCGFFDPTPPPAGLSPRHARHLADAVGHAGGPPIMTREPRDWRRLGRRLGDQEADHATDWEVGVVTWAGGSRRSIERLATGEAPWEAAARLLGDGPVGRPPTLALMRLAAGRRAIRFIFLPSGEQGAAGRPPEDGLTADERQMLERIAGAGTLPLFEVSP